MKRRKETYKVGDLVVVKRCYPNAVVGWESPMDQYVKRVCEVIDVYPGDDDRIYIVLALIGKPPNSAGWVFSPYMLRKATGQDLLLDKFIRDVKGHD